MNDYRPAIPRAALGMAAILLTAGTLLLAVVIPARMDFRSQEIPVFTVSNDIGPGSEPATTQAVPIESLDVLATRGSRWVIVVESGRVRTKPRLQG